MTKHTLFLVHGMGHYEGTDWADKVWQKLAECSKQYKFFETNDLDDWAEPHPVQYDQHIRAALARWDRQATAFQQFAAGNELRIAGNLDWLTGISADDAGFLYTHVIDVIIYYLFKLEQGQIQDSVKLQIAEEIKRKRALDHAAEFSVMAHSLGTAVAHDALAELGGADTLDGQANTFSAQNFKFASIHMLANVSRILQSSPKVYDSVVRPGTRQQSTRYCLRMYSHQHTLDPFTIPRKFEPVTWGSRLEVNNLSHYRGWNIHGWQHYLDHPRVHVPILKAITRRTAISSRDTRSAVDAYIQFGGDLANLDIAKGKIVEMGTLATSLDLDKGLDHNFDTLKAMWKLIEELRNIAGDTWDQIQEVGL